ncbi:MAG: TetR/AcrR family transcriptional regulator [Propionibacteriales bacterium]|nr:TetR/AcrR family transcriptional regulator [Propionibacteriales bacterium]
MVGDAPPSPRNTAARRRPVRTGRRPGNPDTRATIIAAAESEFTAKGFDRVSMRGIAKVAGVDPALVHHYFDSKDDVLLATLDVPFDPREVIPAMTREGAEGLGLRIARRFVSIWDDPDNQVRLVAILRASMSSDVAADLLRSGLVRMIITPISDVIDAPDAVLRAQCVGSQLLGLAMARYVLRLEPLASAQPGVVVAQIGPTLQRYIDGHLPRGVDESAQPAE